MRKTLAFITFFMLVISLHAQDHYLYFAWNYNQPLSNTDFVGGGSGAGARVGYRSQIGESRFMVGVDLNFATYDEYAPFEVFSQPGRDISTDYFKYVYNYGAVVSGQYTFPMGEERIFTPYVGLGLGVNFNVYRMYYNVFTDELKGTGFLMRPEAGATVRFGRRRALGIITAVSYDYSTNKSPDFGYDKFTAFTFQLGLIVTNR